MPRAGGNASVARCVHRCPRSVVPSWSHRLASGPTQLQVEREGVEEEEEAENNRALKSAPATTLCTRAVASALLSWALPTWPLLPSSQQPLSVASGGHRLADRSTNADAGTTGESARRPTKNCQA